MIAAVVESADIEIGDIDIFLPGELEQVVTSFNDTAVDVPEETFYDAFARGVVATPEAIAVRDEAGQATYRELSEQCDRIAGVLYRRGVSVEDVVGLAVPRSVEMVASVLAVLKLGAAYLPLDLSHPSERITYMLTDSRASVLLSTAEESSRIEDVVGVERILLDDPLIRAELDEAVIVELPGHQLASATLPMSSSPRDRPASRREPSSPMTVFRVLLPQPRFGCDWYRVRW